MNWEKDLADLIVFTKEEGLDPDRFHSFCMHWFGKQKEEFKKVVKDIDFYSIGNNPALLGKKLVDVKDILKAIEKL